MIDECNTAFFHKSEKSEVFSLYFMMLQCVVDVKLFFCTAVMSIKF